TKQPRTRSPVFPYTTLFRSHDQPLAVVGQPPALALVAEAAQRFEGGGVEHEAALVLPGEQVEPLAEPGQPLGEIAAGQSGALDLDRKSTRLNSSHVKISYAV